MAGHLSAESRLSFRCVFGDLVVCMGLLIGGRLGASVKSKWMDPSCD